MGDFVTRVHAVGGHGCQRTVKHGGLLAARCGQAGCPDCLAREFVEKLVAAGCQVQVASITHWPAELPGYASASLAEVRDDLVSGVRRGSF